MRGRIYPNSENFVGGDGSQLLTNATSTASKASKVADASQLISVGGEVAGAIITALGSVKDAKLRREYEMRLAELNANQQQKLAEKLNQAQSENDKRKILADAITSISSARIAALNPQKQNVLLYIFGGIVIMAAGIFIYKKLKK